MLRLEGLSARYRRGPEVLHQLSCEFTSNSIGVLGPNGAGKSSLIRVLTTLLRPTSGLFVVGDWTSTDKARIRDHRRALGVMPQFLTIYDGYTCAEFLRYAAWLREVPVAITEARIDEVLEALELREHRDRKVKSLSGGMRQRLGLAQALLSEPRLLVLDEPTAGLDPKQRRRFLDSLRTISSSTTVLFATHLVDDVAAVSSEVLILDKGHLRFAGSLGELCQPLGTAETLAGAHVERAYLALVEGGDE
jgi:ABC-type multidrug transport system ATPase subunit